MEVSQIILAYLEVLLRWPPVVGIVGVVFFGLFKNEVRALIGRIASIRLPGGGEIALPRQSPPSASTEDAPEVPESDVVVLPADVHGEEADRLRDAIRSERAAIYLWEYRYLNLYLVTRTQMVLAHFVGIRTGLHSFFLRSNRTATPRLLSSRLHTRCE